MPFTIEERRGCQRGKILAFKGTKGGVGTTTLAVEFCALATSLGCKTLAVDLDHICGDLPARLNLDPGKIRFRITDLVTFGDELDPGILYKTAAVSEDGVFVLGAPQNIAFEDNINNFGIKRVIESATKAFEYLVLDLPPSTDSLTSCFAEMPDRTVIITTPEISALLRAKQLIESLNNNGKEVFSLVINRSLGSRDVITRGEIESYLGVRATGEIPEKAFYFRLAASAGEVLIRNPGKAGRELRKTLSRIMKSVQSANQWDE